MVIYTEWLSRGSVIRCWIWSGDSLSASWTPFCMILMSALCRTPTPPNPPFPFRGMWRNSYPCGERLLMWKSSLSWKVSQVSVSVKMSMSCSVTILVMTSDLFLSDWIFRLPIVRPEPAFELVVHTGIRLSQLTPLWLVLAQVDCSRLGGSLPPFPVCGQSRCNLWVPLSQAAVL